MVASTAGPLHPQAQGKVLGDLAHEDAAVVPITLYSKVPEDHIRERKPRLVGVQHAQPL